MFKVYFSGGACKGTGNWATSTKDDDISPQDLFGAIRKSGFTSVVSLTIDCPYSGHWCYSIKEYLDKKISPFIDFQEIWV